MKRSFGIIILVALIISNTTLAQDTTHERLVDKFYPKSEQPAPLPKTAQVNPVTTTTTRSAAVGGPVSAVPLHATVTAPPPPDTEPAAPVSEISKDVAPVNQTVSQAPAQPGQINNQPGQINKNTINNKTKIGTDNYNQGPPSPIYRDTRLGSSSPLYNTYEKNDNGAGSITTNPNKG